MARFNEFETTDEEVKELLRNYKNKKATLYEPCTVENYRECLIGLTEELSLYNINYVFNPYLDITENTLQVDALVKLINAVWTLIHYHKNSTEKAERLEEQNHIFEHTIKQLNGVIKTLKDKASIEKNEAKACIASAQRISDQSEGIYKTLSETRAKLIQVTKQKETKEKSLQNEITRLKCENGKLLDRLRNKSGSFTPCSEVCDSTLLSLKEKERKQRAMIAQLQVNNQSLLRELIAMKEELILGGLCDVKLDKDKH